jgi:uncharacterized protein
MNSRYLFSSLSEFAKEKMVFITGPRQVGKTTLSQDWLRSSGQYLSWDIESDRDVLLSKVFQSEVVGQHKKIVIDEIHKYLRWRNLIKGAYDKNKNHTQIVVTGSSRLDTFKKAGDSLLGRYDLLRLHPFSVGELVKNKNTAPPDSFADLSFKVCPKDLWTTLCLRSGFPEPFSKDNSLQYNRWSSRRKELLIRQDLREISEIKTISLVEKLAVILPSKVKSPLSLNSLREDLNVHHATVCSWVDALDALYFSFRISPFDKKITRSVKKEKKLYLWDCASIIDEAAKFENIVALHLLKAVQCWKDLGYGDYDLHFWRSVDGEEIDFVITLAGDPVCAVECKLNAKSIDKSFAKFKAFYPKVPCYQLVNSFDVDFESHGIRLMSASHFLTAFV